MNFCSKVNTLMFPHDFTPIKGRGNCCFTPIWYSVFRIAMFSLYAIDFGYCVYFFKQKDLLYFTSWGLIGMMTCASVLLAENLFNWCMQGRKTNFKYWKVSHFIFTMVLIFEMFITGVYWGGIFPYAIINLWGQIHLYDILNPVMAHAVPIVLLLIDFQFNLVVIWNAIYIPFYIGLLIVYLLINCIYSIEVDVIYDLITYKTWMTYLFLGACLAVILVCHFITRLYCRFCKQQIVLRILDQSEQVSLANRNQINSTTMTHYTFANKRLDTSTFQP